jgi:chromosomal replication initiator protein
MTHTDAANTWVADAATTWAAALGQLQLSVNKPNFDTWLRDTVGLRFDDDVFVVGARNDFTREWLDIRMRKVIVQAVARVLGRPVDVSFEVAAPDAEDAIPRLLDESLHDRSLEAGPTLVRHGVRQRPHLHPALTFETFVVGEENGLAHAAAESVVANPGRTNPLVIFGGSGLGKTHLLNAIGHAAYREGLNVVYATAERFGTEFGGAVQHNSFEKFRRKFRECDVLLVDDIQFFESRAKFQEEFFHTFDSLHAAGKQVVVTCDRLPSQLAGMTDALRSRLMWGIQADVRKPSFPTRLAILRAKAAHHAFRLPEAALEQIAQRCCPTVRELEGYLNRVIMHLPLIGGVASPEAIDRALHVFNTEVASGALQADVVIDADRVIDTVSERTGNARAQLVGRSRNREVSYARHLAMYILKHDAHKAVSEIQRLFGNRDHSTVIGAIDRIEAELGTRPETAADLAAVRQALAMPPAPLRAEPTQPLAPITPIPVAANT